jgi:rare lipoprotein A
MPISKWWTALPLLVLGSASADAESGFASFYPGVGKTGEMTCAHRSHPFGKKLRVSHGKISIECRVNDRGPFIRGRIIDVSTSAARALGMIDAGVVHVLVEAVDQAKKAFKDTNNNAAREISVPLDVL